MMAILDACGTCNADCSGVGSGATCGDGSLCPEFEFCDDGNTDECDGCYGDCSRADNVCGDSILECAETCDDGNTAMTAMAVPRLVSATVSVVTAFYSHSSKYATMVSPMPAVPVTRTVLEAVPVLPAATVKSVQKSRHAMTALPTAVVAAMLIAQGLGVAPVCGDGEHCVESEFCDDGYTDACGSCNADCSAGFWIGLVAMGLFVQRRARSAMTSMSTAVMVAALTVPVLIMYAVTQL